MRKVIQNIAVVGGDLRIVKLVAMMEKEGFSMKTYALEKAYEITSPKCNTLE